MQRLILTALTTLVIVFPSQKILAQSRPTYDIAETPWETAFGNHRAVVEVSRKAEAVKLYFDWRRHDKNPEKRRLLIVNATTGDSIQNVHRLIINNETCKLVFGPAEKGNYHFYYLPFKPDTLWGYYRYDYLQKESTADKDWITSNKLKNPKNLEKLPRARVEKIEARTAFDSFYPMEVIATAVEREEFINSSKSDYIAITEGREFPIRMRDHPPLKWIKEGISHKFEGTVQKK